MEPNTMESGSLGRTSDKVMVCKYGLMAACMKGGGKITKQTAKED